MPKANNSIEDFIETVHTAIHNALGVPEIATELAAHGYDSKRITEEGKLLYDQALPLIRAQEREQGEATAAMKALQQIREELDLLYAKGLKLARVIFDADADARKELGLIGSRKQSNTGKADQIRQFFVNAQAKPAYADKLAQYGFGKVLLERGMSLLADLDKAIDAYARESGQALGATAKRDAAIDALAEWFSPFAAIARVALEGQPDLLHQLGL